MKEALVLSTNALSAASMGLHYQDVLSNSCVKQALLFSRNILCIVILVQTFRVLN